MTKLKPTNTLIGVRIDYYAKCCICKYLIGIVFTGSAELSEQTRFICINCCNQAYTPEPPKPPETFDEELDNDLKTLLAGKVK